MISESFRDIECLKAASYDEGIRLINENVINFFLLDIQLGNDPDKDGIALGEYIRSLDGYQTTPILFVTALVDQAVRAIHSTNCYDYITKPYDQSELLKAIQRLLNLSMVEDPLVELKDINGVYMRTSQYACTHCKGIFCDIGHTAQRSGSRDAFFLYKMSQKLPGQRTSYPFI